MRARTGRAVLTALVFFLSTLGGTIAVAAIPQRMPPPLHARPAARATRVSNGSAAESILYRFSGGIDGANPVASLLIDAAGRLYGTTKSGGSHGRGTVFMLSRVGTSFRERTLYSFAGGADGATPVAGLIADAMGALYGTTSAGGGCGAADPTGCGTVFRLTPSSSGTYDETVLYRFRGGADGSDPTGSLVPDARGTLYGTTEEGGRGYGTVYSIVAAATRPTERILHRFAGGSDGATPEDGNGVIIDGSGIVYGTTMNGGSSTCSAGCGTVFALVPSGATYLERVLHRFTYADGANPTASLIAGADGRLYGTAEAGGIGPCGCGVVYAVTTNGSLGVLYRFASYGGDGYAPTTRLTLDNGELYGTTAFGGNCGIAPFFSCGNVFELAPALNGYGESIVADFAGGSDGATPQAGLALRPGVGNVAYGTTENGGSTACGIGCGTVFELVLSASPV